MRKVCIQVPQHLGELVRSHLVKYGLLDAAFPIGKQNGHLWFPLQRPLSKKEQDALKAVTHDFTLITKDLNRLGRKPQDLKSSLSGQLPESLLELLPHSFDIIGDIAIVELEPPLFQYEPLIGQAIMTVNSRVNTVYAKEGGVEGIFRIRPLRRIAGKSQTTTIHTEYGLRIAVDVAKTFFSPRLSTEHDRVASLVQPNEVIVDLFTGVGPFALHAAKRHPVVVYAIDLNEDAIRCLQKSLTLNRLQGEVIALTGDARTIVEQSLTGKADRVIMNLPHGALDFIEAAVQALKPRGGVIHFYGVSSEAQSLEALTNTVITRINQCNRTAKPVHTRIIRPSAPHEFQVVVDLEVS